MQWASLPDLLPVPDPLPLCCLHPRISPALLSKQHMSLPVARFFALKHGNRIFFEEGVVPRRVDWQYDKTLFQRWKEGRTGMPLVDANMRELQATGARTAPIYSTN
jgi:FAD binding domain of DNA photolyase